MVEEPAPRRDTAGSAEHLRQDRSRLDELCETTHSGSYLIEPEVRTREPFAGGVGARAEANASRSARRNNRLRPNFTERSCPELTSWNRRERLIRRAVAASSMSSRMPAGGASIVSDGAGLVLGVVGVIQSSKPWTNCALIGQKYVKLSDFS